MLERRDLDHRRPHDAHAINRRNAAGRPRRQLGRTGAEAAVDEATVGGGLAGRNRAKLRALGERELHQDRL
jgi:hypothetical protein